MPRRTSARSSRDDTPLPAGCVCSPPCAPTGRRGSARSSRGCSRDSCGFTACPARASCAIWRDPRFSLHTATVDTHVSEGDAKVWGAVHDVQDPALHRRYASWLVGETGLDIRGRDAGEFYAADLAGASSVEVADSHLDVTIWHAGEPERVIRKH